eukprot:3931961-Rhodomonas_salina.1
MLPTYCSSTSASDTSDVRYHIQHHTRRPVLHALSGTEMRDTRMGCWRCTPTRETRHDTPDPRP